MPRPVSLRDPAWLSLGQASRLLGVSEATIRRWSDAGRLATFTTPGGHRRFPRRAIERLIPSGRAQRPAIERAGLTPARLTRAYRREASGVAAAVPWLTTLPVEIREELRVLGRRLAAELVAHLDAGDPEQRSHHLREATALAAEYGRHGATLRRSMSEVVEGFLAFRRPFLGEVAGVARRRGFDATELAGLYDDAERAMDRLLVAAMSGWSVGRVGRSGDDR